MKTRDALYLGGAVLLAATLIAQSANAQLILQIVMVITSAVLLVLGFRKERCLRKSKISQIKGVWCYFKCCHCFWRPRIHRRKNFIPCNQLN